MGGFGGTPWGGSNPTSTAGVPASDLIYHALRLAGVTQGPDRIPSPEQYNDGKRSLNRMLQSWNRRVRDLIATIRVDLYSTAANVQSYSFGPGGDWNAPRPMRIKEANFLYPTSPTIRRPLDIWDDAQWAALSLQAVYTYPKGLYYQKESDVNSALGTVRLYPIPDAVYQIELYTPQDLQQAVDLTTLLVYDEGYEEAIVYNLAKALMGMFRDRLKDQAGDALVIEQARASLARIHSPYSTAPRISTDPIRADRGKRGFNWMSGVK